MDFSGFRRTIRACTVPVGQRTFLRCILSMILCIALFFFTMQAVLADDPAMPVRSINHRGYNTVAPENTLPAYELSKENGFQIVETDIAFTKDGVPTAFRFCCMTQKLTGPPAMPTAANRTG